MSALLRQPHGFEGFFSIKKASNPRQLGVLHFDDVEDDALDGKSATTPTRGQMHAYKHRVACFVNELLGRPLPALDRFRSGFHPAPQFVVATINGCIGHLGNFMQLGIDADISKPGIEIEATQGFVAPPDVLQILRHRPRSIPQAQESA